MFARDCFAVILSGRHVGQPLSFHFPCHVDRMGDISLWFCEIHWQTQTNRDPHGTNLVSATCDLSLFVLSNWTFVDALCRDVPLRFCSPVIASPAFPWADTPVCPFYISAAFVVVSKERGESIKTWHVLILLIEETKFSLFECWLLKNAYFCNVNGEKATSTREQRKFTCFAERKWFHVIKPLTFEKHFAQVQILKSPNFS